MSIDHYQDDRPDSRNFPTFWVLAAAVHLLVMAWFIFDASSEVMSHIDSRIHDAVDACQLSAPDIG